MTYAATKTDNYLSHVLKHIPSEIVMVYIALDGVLRTSYNAAVFHERQTLANLLWGITVALTLITPLWLWRVMRVRRITQLVISTISVPVWLFALGGPFAMYPWYQPAFGAVVLPLYTLVIPIIFQSR